MKKILAVFFALAVFTALASAQPRAVGFRAGGSVDLSYQHCFDSRDFLQADLGVNYLKYSGGLLNVTYNFIVGNVKQFNFFVGPGGHVGFYYKDGTPPPGSSEKISATFAFGLTGQMGAEYMFKKIPLNLSVEWRPTWSIVGNVFDPSSICLGVRYRLF